MKCPQCEHENRAAAKFCDECAASLKALGPGSPHMQSYAEVTSALSEALDQQTATSEILRVISRSPIDVQPVLEAVAESAARLCDAPDVSIFLHEADRLRVAARHGSIPSDTALPLSRGTAVGAAVLAGQTMHVADMQAEAERFPVSFQNARRLGFRTALNVPLMREGVAIGAISLRRTEAELFTERQVALLETFADQAVIAIENVRLFNETKEALEQQTATANILRTISGSPTDVQPVFDIIAENAARLCDGVIGGVYLVETDTIHLVAHCGFTRESNEWTKFFPRRIADSPSLALPVETRDVAHFADIANDDRIGLEGRHIAVASGMRSAVLAPMVHDGAVIGLVGSARNAAAPFTDRQIALLRTFASQAVIAIENVRLFKELEAANRDLAGASRHKSEFLANMSHELRTPLNAIIGFSEVLGERMFGELNEKQEEYLKDIHASGQHLLSLINDILDLSKVEAGRMELELTDFHLPTALDNALTLVRERAGRRGIALHMTVDERLGQIQADERKIRQVVLNLLSNAIKFTPEGGSINVRAMPGDGVVEVSVSDTGVGIAPEDQEAIFEEFRQVGTAAKKVEGTGLGLALSRKFIELHGGRIWVQSQVGVGSTFTFTIPMRT